MNKRCPISGQSFGEEIANAVTHGLGFLLSIVGCSYLIIASNGWRYIIYGMSLVMLYAASTFYHMARHEKLKRALQIADHSCIFLLIAGSFTPFMLGPLMDSWGWGLFALVWSVTLLGIPLKAIFLRHTSFFSTLPYLALSWSCVMSFPTLLREISSGATVLLLVGGFLYTSGVLFYLWEKLPYSHAVWHLFVLAGSGCHYASILSINA